MRRYITISSYWLGSICAGAGLLARSLDVFGMNFIDFNTKGGGIGYHSLMDGTLFFYAISIGNATYGWLVSHKSEWADTQEERRTLIVRATEAAFIGSYWLGSVCAGLGLLARGLDFFAMNFIDFDTKGGGIGYHSLMDGTLFFYAISAATASYRWLTSQEPARAMAPVLSAQEAEEA